MTAPQEIYAASQGSPNLGVLQYLQDNWGKSEISAALRICKVTVATGGDAGIEADIPVGAEIIDAVTLCTRSNGSGSMQIKTNADSPVAISDAMACVTADVVAHAGTIDSTYSIVGSDGIAVFANAAADGGIVYIFYIKP